VSGVGGPYEPWWLGYNFAGSKIEQGFIPMRVQRPCTPLPFLFLLKLVLVLVLMLLVLLFLPSFTTATTSWRLLSSTFVATLQRSRQHPTHNSTQLQPEAEADEVAAEEIDATAAMRARLEALKSS